MNSISPQIKLARWAVIIFFFTNGFLFANWTARIPEIELFYDISHAQLGSILFTLAIGSVLAMPFAGYLNNKWGSKRVTIITGFLFTTMIIGIAIYPSILLVYTVYFFMGVGGGAMDVSMNGQAVVVEQEWGKSIMSFFHATFSIGMVLGAGIGALATRLDIPLFYHLSGAAILGIIALLWASKNLIDDSLDTFETQDGGSGFALPTAAIMPVAIVAFCGMTGEGSLNDWSALFMHEIAGASMAIGAIAFGTYSAAMTIGRIFGDRFTDMLGRKKMLLAESLLAIFGLVIALTFATPAMTLVGFFISGIGLSNIVPICYSAAGNTPGVKPAVGIAMATTVGYSGFFVGPPLIGYLADLYDLRWALCFTLVLFLVMIIIIYQRKSF